MNVAVIHDALAAQLRSNIARDVTVYAFDPGEGGRSYPCIVIDPGDPYVEYHTTFGDNALAGIELRVRVLINAAELDQRIALADFSSAGTDAPSSILGAVETSLSLGNVVANVCCFRVHGFEPDEPGVLSATFDVQVRTHREEN